MLSRVVPVPYYSEMRRMIGEIAADYVVDGTRVYDLGCATCNAFFELDRVLPRNVKFVGVDFSSEMLDQARDKTAAQGFKRVSDQAIVAAEEAYLRNKFGDRYKLPSIARRMKSELEHPVRYGKYFPSILSMSPAPIRTGLVDCARRPCAW